MAVKYDIGVLKKKLEQGYEFVGISIKQKDLRSPVEAKYILLRKGSEPFPMEYREDKNNEIDRVLREYGNSLKR